jgi:hypothetical protein
MKLIFISLIVLLINIPFGYWRGNVKKFSFQWILSVHIPVPFIIALRFLSGLGFALITYPVLVGAFFVGQLTGKKLFSFLNNNNSFGLTSCLPCDIFKIIRSYLKNAH